MLSIRWTSSSYWRLCENQTALPQKDWNFPCGKVSGKTFYCFGWKLHFSELKQLLTPCLAKTPNTSLLWDYNLKPVWRVTLALEASLFASPTNTSHQICPLLIKSVFLQKSPFKHAWDKLSVGLVVHLLYKPCLGCTWPLTSRLQLRRLFALGHSTVAAWSDPCNLSPQSLKAAEVPSIAIKYPQFSFHFLQDLSTKHKREWGKKHCKTQPAKW